MRRGASAVLRIGAIVALAALFPSALLAADGGDPAESAKQAGEDRWVPSLAITSGVTLQKQRGSANSVLFLDMDSSSEPLRGFVKGKDTAVSAFVGGVLELMTPALPIPTRPRLFVSGEILPTFASDRDLALDGDPGCVRGPESDAECAKNEPIDEDGNPVRLTPFGEDSARGHGSRTSAQIDTLVYGASLGAAFPLKIGKRQLRIKPSVGWINYKVEVEGLVVDADCGDPGAVPPSLLCNDFLRETILSANDSQRFNGIGPGLDVEMDTGRFGPIGSSLFLGARAYRILGDRTISLHTKRDFPERRSDLDNPPDRIIFGPETNSAAFEVEVDPWMFRAHVGIRFQWLGGRK